MFGSCTVYELMMNIFILMKSINRQFGSKKLLIVARSGFTLSFKDVRTFPGQDIPTDFQTKGHRVQNPFSDLEWNADAGIGFSRHRKLGKCGNRRNGKNIGNRRNRKKRRIG